MKTLATLLIFLSVSVFAQVPPPTAAYVSPNGGVTWVPATSSSTIGAISYTPPPSGFYCLNTGTSQWVPCTSVGGGAALPVTGATADYHFNQGTGMTLTDFSGNGNNGTLGGGSSTVPTWTPIGLAFNLASNGGFDGVGQNGVQLPSALNNSKTIFMAVSLPNLVPVSGIANSPHFPVFLTSSLGGSGVNLMNWYTATATASTYGMGVFANGATTTEGLNQVSGFHVFAWTLGTGGGDLDHMYVDGVEIASYQAQGSSYGFQTSGNFYIGSSNTSVWASQITALFGTAYRAVFYPTEFTAGQVASVSGSIAAEAASRGVPTNPVPLALGLPTLHCIGDSITYGLGVPTPYCGLLTLDATQPSYNIINWGIDSITVTTISGMEANRVGLQCKSTRGPVMAVVTAGTNDIFFGNTPALTLSYLASEVRTLTNAGCGVFVGTMLSRSGTQSGTGTSMDVLKDTFDADILSQVQQMGAVGVVDWAANPLLGADGASANLTYFQADGTHPTTAGQTLMANAMSNTLNYYNGFKSGNPHVISATTYTLLSGDAFVQAAPTANAAYTMPDCTGPSGAIYTISNPQSAFTLTVKGGTSQPINGLSTAITIASNSTVTLRDIANPKATSGCQWAM